MTALSSHKRVLRGDVSGLRPPNNLYRQNYKILGDNPRKSDRDNPVSSGRMGIDMAALGR